VFSDGDSVCVHGYLFGKDGQIHDVTMSGPGNIIDAEKIKNDENFRIQSTEPFKEKARLYEKYADITIRL
jgi:hypothetical protein